MTKSTSWHTQARFFGYIATMIMHGLNTYFMVQRFEGPHMRDKDIQFFVSMQTRFFTGWTFILQMVYSLTGLVCELYILKNSHEKGYKLNKYLRGFRDTLFAGVVWPSTWLVATFFWAVYLYDRSLILPQILDQVLSVASNHVIHTAIVPVVLWEVAFHPRQTPASHRKNLGHLVFHISLYLTVMLYTYYETGRWLYPVMGVIYGTIYFPILLATILLMLISFYYLQWLLTRLFWGEVSGKKVR